MARPSRTGRHETRVEPEGKVRRSQVVTTYGPGAMIDLVDQAVLVGGLDFWSWSKEHGRAVLHEPRLRDQLADFFRAMGRELSVSDAFIEPPLCDERNPSRFVGVQVLEFPTWFVCQGCRALIRKDALDLKGGRYEHQCNRSTKRECVPVRFVGACKRGHVDDWSWDWFAHFDGQRCGAPALTLEEDASGDFSRITVRCQQCGLSSKLNRVYADGFTVTCRGERPWLGREGKEECDEPLKLLVRTATNSYFAQSVSALWIPDPAADLDDKIATVWDVLVAATPDNLASFRAIPKVQSAVAGFSDADVLAAIATRRAGTKPAREQLRTAEFRQLVGAHPEKPGELPDPDRRFFARTAELETPLPEGIARIVLASKLREVRAEIGFTRLEPATPNLQGEYDLGVQTAMLGLQTDWLPATEIRGEGILIQLDEEAVVRWEARKEVEARTTELLAGWDAHIDRAHAKSKAEVRERARKRFPGTRFYLLHSLSHLLVDAISLECGYSASAIRERIYCAPADAQVPMAAILLITGTSGSEGTLGGLIEQGRVIHEHLRRAWDLGSLCSNDPVCGGHTPSKDHAERFLEGAACHGCLYVAECSCEWFNRHLDRALVVPTIGQPSKLAFFGARP